MTTITIPKRFGYPTVDIYINGKKYTFSSGVEISVEDEIAGVVNNAVALEPKEGRNLSRIAQLAEGRITVLTASDLEGVTDIYNYAFYNCDRFQSVVIPNSVTNIGYSAFRYCGNLKTLQLPKGLLSISERAFDNCISLVRVIVKAEIPPIIQPETFTNIPTSCVFEVPSKSLDAYKKAAYWSSLANQIIAVKE